MTTQADFWSQIWTAAVQVASLLAKGTISAGAVTALSWFTCEWVLFPFRKTSEMTKRHITLAAGMAMVFLAHWTGRVDFGPGPKGWGAAMFFGFLGGGLAPMLHAKMKERFPELLNSATPGGRT